MNSPQILGYLTPCILAEIERACFCNVKNIHNVFQHSTAQHSKAQYAYFEGWSSTEALLLALDSLHTSKHLLCIYKIEITTYLLFK